MRDADFPRKWYEMEKRTGASYCRHEAIHALELEETLQVTWGKEAAEWLYLRRLYHNPEAQQLVS